MALFIILIGQLGTSSPWPKATELSSYGVYQSNERQQAYPHKNVDIPVITLWFALFPFRTP
jgi:hypothetical protein